MTNRLEHLRQRHDRLGLFLRIWFGFVALLGVSLVVCIVWLFVLLVDAGPEGLGEGIGRFIGSIERGMDQ